MSTSPTSPIPFAATVRVVHDGITKLGTVIEAADNSCTIAVPPTPGKSRNTIRRYNRDVVVVTPGPNAGV